MSYSQDQQEQMIENCNGFRFCTDCESLCLPDRAGLNINEIIFKCIACGDRTFLIRNDDPDDRIIK